MSTARELLATRIDDSAMLADAAIACAREGEPIDGPPLAAAIYAFDEARTRMAAPEDGLAPLLALPAEDRRRALIVAAELVPTKWAPALVGAYLHEGIAPLSARLALLAAGSDSVACERLLDAARELGDDVWAGLAAEVVVAANDGRVSAMPRVHERLVSLDPHGLAERELLTLRLRLGARQDPSGALPLVTDAIDAVGAYGVETGIEAVVGRLGPSAGALLGNRPLPERALVRRAGGWEVEDRTDALEPLVRELATTSMSEEDAWTASFELLSAAARIGAADLAAAVVAASGPPTWGAFNAIWAPLRKRAGDSRPVLDAVEAALMTTGPGRAAEGAGPPPEWAYLPPDLQRSYVELRSRPAAWLPWWRPWDGGLP